LVPALEHVLSSQDSAVVPLYFWRTREGSSVSLQCDQGTQIRILAMYARRPKVVDPADRHILVKFNRELLELAFHLNEHGIPTLAGVPRVSSIMDLRIGCPCSWFALVPDSTFSEDIEVFVDRRLNQCEKALPAFVRGPLQDKEVADFIDSVARPMLWADAVEVLRAKPLHEHRYSRSFPWHMGGYKPVYFLLVEDD